MEPVVGEIILELLQERNESCLTRISLLKELLNLS